MIHQLGEQIGTKLAKAEEVGAEGNVEESLKAMQEVEDLKKKKAQAEVSESHQETAIQKVETNSFVIVLDIM